jgi:hypothetical protein
LFISFYIFSYKNRGKLQCLKGLQMIQTFSSEKKLKTQSLSIGVLSRFKRKLDPVIRIANKFQRLILSKAWETINQNNKWQIAKGKITDDVQEIKNETLRKLSKKLEEQSEVVRQIDEYELFAREFKLKEAGYQNALAERDRLLAEVETEIKNKNFSKAQQPAQEFGKRFSLLERRVCYKK